MPIALVCPICRYPFGSGGKRKRKLPLGIPFAKSSSIICSIKLSDFLSSDMVAVYFN